jgi:hypothetical protein
MFSPEIIVYTDRVESRILIYKDQHSLVNISEFSSRSGKTANCDPVSL